MRYELKFFLSPVQYHLLRNRLRHVMTLDKNAGTDGDYFIRSIYFDSFEYKSLEEKRMGIDTRKKYRIRFYNGDSKNCQLECKIKKGTRIEKKSVPLTTDEVVDLLSGEPRLSEKNVGNVLGELQLLMKNEGFHASVVVDYVREAYVHPVSNVRITFDKKLAAGRVDDCLYHERYMPNILEGDDMILEVKYDEYLPEHISQIISSIRPVQTAASKYVMCINKKKEGLFL